MMPLVWRRLYLQQPKTSLSSRLNAAVILSQSNLCNLTSMQTVLATFKEKSIEFSTPIRVYCSNPKCSRFLGPKNDGKSPSAPFTCSCTTITCNSCRGNVTNGDVLSHSCASDALEQEVRALADKKKWATCPGCSNLVELSIGCSHMDMPLRYTVLLSLQCQVGCMRLCRSHDARGTWTNTCPWRSH